MDGRGRSWYSHGLPWVATSARGIPMVSHDIVWVARGTAMGDHGLPRTAPWSAKDHDIPTADHGNAMVDCGVVMIARGIAVVARGMAMGDHGYYCVYDH